MQLKKSLLTTLFLSQGVPMLLSGDEMGNTQMGNNNAYCQDNEISWINWQEADTELTRFVRGLIKLRKKHPIFSRKRWFQGLPIRGIGLEDIAWFSPDGIEIPEYERWNTYTHSFAVFYNGLGLRCLKEDGEKLVDDNFFTMINAFHAPVEFTVPAEKYGTEWSVALDTYEEDPGNHKSRKVLPDENIIVPPHAIIVLLNERVSADMRRHDTLPEIAENVE